MVPVNTALKVPFKVAVFTAGTVCVVAVSLTSSTLIEAVPVFTKRIFKPFIWAAAGKLNVLARYHPVAAFTASLNKIG